MKPFVLRWLTIFAVALASKALSTVVPLDWVWVCGWIGGGVAVYANEESLYQRPDR